MADPTSGDLDRLLAAWAGSQRPDAAEAEAILRAVVAEPQGLPATWWRDFGNQLGDAIAQAADASTAAFEGTGWAPHTDAA